MEGSNSETDASNEPEGGPQELGEAIAAWMRLGDASGLSRDELIAEHPELRRLLEPMLAEASKAPSIAGAHPGAEIGLASERLGDYRLERLLGRGGMGFVFEAHDLAVDRHVALKVLPPHRSLDPRGLARFRREATAAGRLTHTGIVTVLAVGEDHGLHYIAQELVPGGRSLADRLEELHRRAEVPSDHYEWAAGFFAEVADALESAHAAGVIHRDVKPSNILIAESGQPRVADFGLARVADAVSLSATQGIVGSPYYMSPEQAIGARELDRRTDVFSLGVTLYEALTLRRPFEGDSTHQVLERVRTHQPPDPRELHARIPRDLATICLCALEKAPERRYSSMQALADDLRRHLADEPIVARTPGPLRRAQLWTRRHPVVAGVGAVGVLALLVVTLLLVRVSREQARVRAESDRLAAALDAMNHIVALATPEQSARNLRVTQASLEAARSDIARTFVDQPRLRIRLLTMLGLAHTQLRQFEQGDELLREALQLGEELGLEEEWLDEARANYALSLVKQRRTLEAEPLVVRVLEDRRRAHGEHDSRVALVRAWLAQIRVVQHRFDEATDLVEQALLDIDETARPIALQVQGNIAAEQGDHERAGQHFAEALELAKTVLPPGHESIARIEADLRLSETSIDREPAPEPPGAAGASSTSGPGGDAPSGSTYESELNSLKLQMEAGDSAGTIEAYFDMLARYEPTYGADSAKLATLHVQLGESLRRTGRLEEALEHTQRAMAISHAAQGPNAFQTLYATSAHALALQSAGRREEALELLTTNLAAEREALGPFHPETVDTEILYANLLIESGRAGEANERYQELAERVSADDPSNLALPKLLLNAANVAGMTGDTELAERRARQALERARAVEGPASPTTFEAANTWAFAATLLDRHDEVPAILEPILEAELATLGPGHVTTSRTRCRLAGAWLELGELEEAERLAREVLDEAAPGDRYRATAQEILQALD